MDFIQEGFIQALKLIVHFDPQTLSAILVTIKTSCISILIALIIGLPLGFILGYFDFFMKRFLKLIVDTFLAMPTVVIGLVLYALISYRGPFGEYGLLYTIPGIIIGQSVLALPIIISLSSTAVENMDKKLSLTLQSFGLSKMQMIKSTLFELRYALLASVVVAYSRVISEIGIGMMIGGNIKWHTRTMTTAISLETSKGEFALAIALGIILIAIALCVNVFLQFLRKKG
ncbi:ABC transporter permease [Helicobacter sp. 13S00477-4]|uniref:ABC transporter permease n=1 Tax=Helicobacter sp. 13S00477-4 TaxID=1905759 RepID=UPI000BA6F8D8|nr:ABC transporter permease [Helicobacter sp. 13S00477-4]PAF52084.1 ABC transporter permease [Helicobacter sp. 13S00477-4]